MDIKAGHTDKLSDRSVLHRDDLPPDHGPIKGTVSFIMLVDFLMVSLHTDCAFNGPLIMSELIRKNICFLKLSKQLFLLR